VIISDLTGFILARLHEEEQDARLFHELTCPADEREARDGFPGIWCRCPVPARTHARVRVTLGIIADCGRQLRMPGSGMPGMPPTAAGVRKALGAMALRYELSPCGRSSGVPDQHRRQLRTRRPRRG
jgi:hypothetical protein